MQTHALRAVAGLALGAVCLASACAGEVSQADSSSSGGAGTGTDAASASVTVGSGGASATTAATTSSTTTSVVSTSTGGGPAPLGGECAADSQCGAGSKCLLASQDDPILGGGPAAGYCSKDCQSDSDCPNGTCLFSGSGGECFLDCSIGPALEYIDDPLDPEKCLAREDVRCTAVAGGAEVCMPTCGVDAQCGGGRVCDPRLSVCVDPANVSMGLPAGAKCDATLDPPECAGVCVNFNGGLTMCSSACVLAGELDLYDCGGLTGGLCSFSPSSSGPGDYAFCAPACSAHSDCQNPAFWCTSISGITGALVANGYCYGGQGACPNGNECDSATTCTPTAYGPLCLDPAFPLGS